MRSSPLLQRIGQPVDHAGDDVAPPVGLLGPPIVLTFVRRDSILKRSNLTIVLALLFLNLLNALLNIRTN